jgi:sugar phosphate isomerase/epimerase
MQTSISRRTFLTLTAAVPLAGRLSAARSAVPVGLELYSVRDALARDLPGTVRAVAKMGYQVVEFYSPYYEWTPQTAAEVRTLLDDLGIACRSTHNGANAFTDDGLQKAIDLNRTIGSTSIIMASPGRHVTSLEDWNAVADRLNTAAERLKPLGMTAGYHNHGPEWHEVDGRRPMDVLAANTGKDVVLQLDVGTCVAAGADPVAWIQSNPGRIRSIHCKDWAGDGRGYSVLFGEGHAPWKEILAAAESVGGVECYLIEQEEGPAEEQLLRAERCLANWRKLRA